MSEEREVWIPADGGQLAGRLTIPDSPLGVVLFAHGSGSSRHSARNRAVARALQEAGLATLVFDLLSEDEVREDERTQGLRFNIRLLAERVAAAIDWLQRLRETAHLHVGCYGSSTGAAAALVAAAARPAAVGAVVSRGGRPDLAGDALSRVQSPTLLLVGSKDEPVLELNREALLRLHGERELRVIPGAGHLFEEPGALEAVAREAAEWFAYHLPRAGEQAVHL